MSQSFEQLLQKWGEQERQKTISTSTTKVRVWNLIQSKMAEVNAPQKVSGWPAIRSFSEGWLQSLMRWSLVPVAAMALLVLTTTVEKNTDIQGSPQPLPVVLNNNNKDTMPLNVVDIEKEPLTPTLSPEGRGGTVASLPRANRRIVVKRELYAFRGQSVFVAWGTSVFSPEQLTSTSQEQFGRSVFSEL